MNMKQLRIWLNKLLNIQIILGSEHPRPELKVVYVVRLLDVMIVWIPALALVGFTVFYELMYR